MGIPTQFAIGPVNCLSGPETEAFDDAELRTMLSGGLMLDSEACKVFVRRGFGEYLPGRHHHELNLPSVERIIEGPLATGIVNRLMPLCRHDPEGVFGCRLDVWEPAAGATPHTVIQDIDGKIRGHGILSAANTLGGRIVVISDPPIRRGPNDRLTWLTHAKSELIGRLVEWLYGESPWIRLAGAPNAAAFLYLDHSKQNGLLAVANVGLDPVTPTLRGNGSWSNMIRSPENATFQVDALSMRLFQLTPDIHRHE
ncbi:MAG: hypothetical protein IT446_11170 [Phycisphaerales bacterium]|nr:hypothetical protein [Phycisphaerales bacterium]